MLESEISACTLILYLKKELVLMTLELRCSVFYTKGHEIPNTYGEKIVKDCRRQLFFELEVKF